MDPQLTVEFCVVFVRVSEIDLFEGTSDVGGYLEVGDN